MRRKDAMKVRPPQGGRVHELLSEPAAERLGTLLAGLEDDLHDFCVGMGLEMFDYLVEREVELRCGPEGRHDPERTATRWSRREVPLTLGGRQVRSRVRRVRSVGAEPQEVPLEVVAHFQRRDRLDQRALEQILCGVSTRRYARSLEPLPPGVEERGTSKSSVSRRFVALTQARMEVFLGRSLDGFVPLVLMLDGVKVRSQEFIVALGMDEKGHKRVLGLRQGSTENSRLCTDLLQDLVGRGLSTKRALLVVIDGSKALRKAVRDVLGPAAVVQRCQLHKRRNVKEYLPAELAVQVERQMVEAYGCGDAERAHALLEKLARALEREHPDAAASLREGLEETLTVLRLGLPPLLRQVLSSTNAIESVFAHYAHLIRNVKRWRHGQMLRRWTATMLQEAEGRFHRLKGYQQLPVLVAALKNISLSLDTASQAA